MYRIAALFGAVAGAALAMTIAALVAVYCVARAAVRWVRCARAGAGVDDDLATCLAIAALGPARHRNVLEP